MKAVFLAALVLAAPAFAQDKPEQKLVRQIFKELVEIDTTDVTTPAVRAMEKRLLAAGYARADVQVLGQNPNKLNLVARYRGTGKSKPILFLAHLDVVAALRDDWSVEPFKLLEKDGYLYGRGTSDDKSMAAIGVEMLIRFKKDKRVLDRDLVVALTADEEGGDDNGVSFLLDKHRRCSTPSLRSTKAAVA